MFKQVISKVSKRTAIIILLIAAFSIAGIISCAQDFTQPTASQFSTEDDTGEETITITNVTDTGESSVIQVKPDTKPKPWFHEDTYMTVYTPWRGYNYPRVSWQDSETLLTIWKEMMSRKWPNDGKRWYIKGAAYGNWDPNPTSWKDKNLFYWPPNNSYYYFDKNYDIVYYSDARKASIKIMKLVGAAIVRWNKARNDNNKAYIGTWAVGGIYQTILTREQIDEFCNYSDSDHNLSIKKDLNFFIRYDHMASRNNKPLQVITMNLGYNDQWFEEFGIDMYYHTTSSDYNNITAFTSKSPQELDKFLNTKINLSWQWKLDWHNWRFFPRSVDYWHYAAHPDSGWVSRK